MVAVWLPGAELNQGNDAGAMNGDGSRKLLFHDTEGTSIAGAVAAYTANNSWPHLTVDCRRRRIQQHVAFDRAARALRNEAGGVETNRDGTYLVQIEIVGFANNRDDSMFVGTDHDWFGKTVVGPICRELGVPVRSDVTWVSYPASYGTGAAQRLSAASWDAYSGILGHQHCPENSHGDPGLIDIARILRAAAGEEDDMTPEQEAKLDQAVAAANGAALFAKLVWDLNTPAGFRYVDPKTFALVSKDTPGAKPVLDVVRHAREAALGTRREEGDHATLEDLLADIKAWVDAQSATTPSL